MSAIPKDSLNSLMHSSLDSSVSANKNLIKVGTSGIKYFLKFSTVIVVGSW